MVTRGEPRHAVTVRSAADEEAFELVARLRAGRRGRWGCMLFFAISVGTAGGMFSLLLGASSFSSFVVVAGVVGASWLVLMVSQTSATFRLYRELFEADARDRQVEIISVTGCCAVDLSGGHSSVDPAVAIDIGEAKLLVLKGPWLREEGYGVRKGRFPSSSFTLSRWPHSGEIVALETEGPHVPASTTQSGVKLTALRPVPSLVIEGTLDDVAGAITRASEPE